MFSLCIPTMNRFDTFLVKYLPLYLANDLIDEIVISDETGYDVQQILKVFGKHSKMKLNINDVRKGPFLNKLICCKLAKNEWIALIDSDNYADVEYFKTVKNYIDTQLEPNKQNIILSPCFAMPNFNYTHLSGVCFKKGKFKEILELEHKTIGKNVHSDVLMNTGNYVLNKYLIEHLDLSKELDLVHQSSACDVIYLNTLLFEQLNLELYVVPNLKYNHVVHSGSIYTQTANHTRNCINLVNYRYNRLKQT